MVGRACHRQPARTTNTHRQSRASAAAPAGVPAAAAQDAPRPRYGRIAHEITTDANVADRGNAHETAQFVMTVGKPFDWTGDLDFARELYPAMKLGCD